VPAVFISYSRRDKAFVQQLHDALKGRGYDVWVDWEDIPPSAEWFDEIRTGVERADGFVYVISPDSARSVTCGKELENALKQNKRVVPVLHRDPDGAEVPAKAAALNWVFLRDSDDFDAGIRTLTEALETDLEHVRAHTRLGVQAARWESSHRNGSQLLRGSELSAAEAWLVSGADKLPKATQLQHEFILASRQASVRRQRGMISAVSVALMIAIALTVVALIQRSQANQARSVAQVRQLDATAVSDQSSDPEQSVVEAARAARQGSGTSVLDTLQTSLVKSDLRAVIPLTYFGGGDVIWSPNGTRVLVTNPGASEGWSRIYTPGSSARPIVLPGPPSRGQSSWDADGNRVLIGGGRAGVYDATTGRLIRRLSVPVLFGALTAAGSEVVNAAFNGDGQVIDVATGRIVRTFHPGANLSSTCFALSPDGRYAASCLQSQTAGPGFYDEVAIWSTATRRLVRAVRASSLVNSVAFSPSGRQFAFAEDDLVQGSSPAAKARDQDAPGVFLYDTTGSGAPITTFPGAARSIVFSPNPARPTLAYSSVTDDLVYAYELYSGRSLPMTGATGVVQAVQFNSDGAQLVAGGDDDIVRVYDAATGGQPIETLAGDAGPIVSVGIDTSEHYVASSSTDETARLWQGPVPVPSASRSGADAVTEALSYSPDGRRLLQVGGGNTFTLRRASTASVLDANDLKPLDTFTAPPGQIFFGGEFTPDGRRILALTGSDGKSGAAAEAVVDRNGSTGAAVATLTPSPGFGLFDAFVSQSGDQVTLLGSDGRAEVYDGLTGHLEHALDGETTVAGAAAFSADGRLLAIAHYPPFQDKKIYGPISVQVWNVSTGSLEHTFTVDSQIPDVTGQDAFVMAVAFSPDGRLLAVAGGDGVVVVIDPVTGRSRARLGIDGLQAGSYAATLAFSPNGRYLAAGSASGAYVWTLPNFKPEPIFQHISPDQVPDIPTSSSEVRVGFTSNSQSLVTEGDETVEIWSVADALQLCKASPEAAASVSPDGATYVTAGGAGLSEYACPLVGGVPQLLSLARHRTPGT
jgi:WD40 repeat protein